MDDELANEAATSAGVGTFEAKDFFDDADKSFNGDDGADSTGELGGDGVCIIVKPCGILSSR